MARLVKDPLALSLQQPGLLSGHRFSPQPRNFHLTRMQSRKRGEVELYVRVLVP